MKRSVSTIVLLALATAGCGAASEGSEVRGDALEVPANGATISEPTAPEPPSPPAPGTAAPAPPEEEPIVAEPKDAAAVVLATSNGDLRMPDAVDGFRLTGPPELRTGIPGLNAETVQFERVNDKGGFESYSIAVLRGDEVAAALRAPETQEYAAVAGLFVDGSQVYSRHTDLESEYPVFEFAWGISPDEAVVVLSQYLSEDAVLKIVSSMEESQ